MSLETLELSLYNVCIYYPQDDRNIGDAVKKILNQLTEVRNISSSKTNDGILILINDNEAEMYIVKPREGEFMKGKYVTAEELQLNLKIKKTANEKEWKSKLYEFFRNLCITTGAGGVNILSVYPLDRRKEYEELLNEAFWSANNI